LATARGNRGCKPTSALWHRFATGVAPDYREEAVSIHSRNEPQSHSPYIQVKKEAACPPEPKLGQRTPPEANRPTH